MLKSEINLSFIFQVLFFTLAVQIIAIGQNCGDIIIKDNFSNATNWQHEGTNNKVSVVNNRCKINNITGEVEDRIYRNLGKIISDKYWKTEFDFSITSPNSSGNGAGGLLLALTAGNLDFMGNYNSSSFTEVTQDGVGLIVFSDTYYDDNIDNWYFLMEDKKSSIRKYDMNTKIYLSASISNYYIRLERITIDSLKLSVFSDSLRTVHIQGSPTFYPIDSTITNLNTIQHGSLTPAFYPRMLNATIDNDFICEEQLAGIRDNAMSKPKKNTLYPNPAKDIINITLDPNNIAEYEYRIYNNAGILAKTGELSDNFDIDISDISTGMYVILISQNGNKIHSSKFIKE